MSYILIFGNIVFVKVNNKGSYSKQAEDKYVAGSVSSGLFADEIYTLSEIKAQWPEVKEATFLTFKEVYDSN